MADIYKIILIPGKCEMISLHLTHGFFDALWESIKEMFVPLMT